MQISRHHKNAKRQLETKTSAWNEVLVHVLLFWGEIHFYPGQLQQMGAIGIMFTFIDGFPISVTIRKMPKPTFHYPLQYSDECILVVALRRSHVTSTNTSWAFFLFFFFEQTYPQCLLEINLHWWQVSKHFPWKPCRFYTVQFVTVPWEILEKG